MAARRTNEHPECIIAAWLASGITVKDDYSADIYQKAMAASGKPEYAAVTTEYCKGGGIWSVRFVMLAHQRATLLDQAKDGNNSATIE